VTPRKSGVLLGVTAFLISVSASVVLAEEQTVTLYSVADTFVNRYDPDTVGWTILPLPCGTGTDEYGSWEFHVYIRWDVSAVPAHASVIEAHFETWCDPVYGDDYYLTVRPIASQWSEAATTWNTRPSYDMSLYDQLFIPASNDPLWLSNEDMDGTFTAIVQSWVAGTRTNHGAVLLYDGGETTGVWIGHREMTGAEPRLVITYSTGPPDMTASDVSVTDTSVDPSQEVSVNFRINNIGGSGSWLCTNTVYWSEDATISTTDTPLGNGNTSSIPAGGYTDTSVDVTIPADAVLGQTYYIGVVADTSGTSGETDTSNNASAGVPVLVNPPPAANLTQFGVTQSSVSVDQSFEVYATLRNDGGPGDHGGISISFPDLTSTDGSMPPYDSAKADVATASTTFGEVLYFDQGDTIYADFVPMSALHLLVEADHASWPSGQEKAVSLSVTPHQTGSLKVRIRGWISKGGPDGYGPPVYRDPSGSGGGREQDQQSYWSEVVTVTVTAPPEITSFAINNGDASTTSRTVTLNNTCENSPTHYMASESSDFSGASWQPYSTAPSFTITSPGDGTKWVYFKVKNDDGESPSGAGDTIELTTPPPSVNLVNFGATESSVNLGESFEVYATLQNDGGTGQRGGISISFPDLVDADGSMPPYNSAIADVTTAGTSTLPVGYFAAGDTIYVEGDPVPAQHLLVEGEEPSWASGQTEVLRLIVTPKQAGQLKLRIRGWIEGQGASPVVYRDPDTSGGGREQDQQGYWSEVVTVDVSLRPWTVMVYMNADNNLDSFAIDDFDEMAQVDNASVNIVVQLDRAQAQAWTTARRFLITQGLQPTDGSELEELGEVNMGNPDTLEDFITWARANYPAQNYGLVLWGHGDGWRESAEGQNPFRGVCTHDTNDGAGGTDRLTMQELHQALDNGTGSGTNPIQVINMDACLMAGLEVAYEIKDFADYFAASADLVPGTGNDYEDILHPANLSETTTPQEWAEYLVASYQNQYDPMDGYRTYMACRLDQIDALSTSVSDLASLLRENLEAERSNIENAWSNSRHYEASGSGSPTTYRYVVDLHGFCRNLRDVSTNTEIDNQCSTVMQAVADNMLLDYWADLESSYTTTHQRCFWIYFPPSSENDYATDWGNYNGTHLTFLSSDDQVWDDFLRLYFGTFTLTLDIVNASWGAVQVNPVGPQYVGGTSVALTANPFDGKAFKHWIIYDPTHPGDDAYAEFDTDLSTSVVMDADREVTAVFKCGTDLGPLFPLLLIGVTVSGFVSRRRRSGGRGP